MRIRAVWWPVGDRGELFTTPHVQMERRKKLLDVSRLANLYWRAKTSLREGIAAAYEDFLAGGGR